MTLIELLVLLTTVALLASLTLFAVVRARELAKQVSCRNNMRQIGSAVLAYEGVNRHLPTNGWGFRFLPDSYVDRQFGQPGGWSYQLLPYLELSSLYDLAQSKQTVAWQKSNMVSLITTEIPVYRCPSKGSPLTVKQADYDEYYANFPNPPPMVVGGHYAVNHGTIVGERARSGFNGPLEITREAIEACDWPTSSECNGVCFANLKFRASEITAGLSNVLWAGEKYIMPLEVNQIDSGGHDQSFLSGDSRDNRRMCIYPPQSDFKPQEELFEYGWFDFGASHPGMMFAVFMDGSSQKISFDVDREVWRTQGKRH